MSFVESIVTAIKGLVSKERPLHHHAPFLGKVNLTWEQGYGNVRKFENKLREFCKVRQALAMCNGTAALHMALVSNGVGPGDEVLMPSLTFVGTANAVCHAGATPHFIDSGLIQGPYKLNQYLAKLKETGALKRIKALIVVHLLGFPSNTIKLKEVANSFGLRVIEDAAEALGSTIEGQHCGTIGDAGILSFNNNKIITTNGGGALLTNDEWVLSKAWQLSTTSRIPHEWEVTHDAIAWNYRMPDICAVLGLTQFQFLEQTLAYKRRLARAYSVVLSRIGGVRVLGGADCPYGQPNHWLVPLMLDVNTKKYRNDILKALHNEGILARAMFTPLHRLPMYKDCRCSGEMHMANSAYESIICLPSGAGVIQ